jgi:hypothetical protein
VLVDSFGDLLEVGAEVLATKSLLKSRVDRLRVAKNVLKGRGNIGEGLIEVGVEIIFIELFE